MGNGNVNGLHNTNKYVQGSVWKWTRKEYAGNSAGVQSSERPVLIISNDTFNAHSQSVNCVSITSILKESPVHVPLYITMDSHIQCEQIHTVSKSELVEYKGMVPAGILSNVKVKLRLQLDMGEDRTVILFDSIKKSMDELAAKSGVKNALPENTALLNAIKDSLHDLNRKANKGFGIPELENDMIRILTNIQANYETLKADIGTIKSSFGKNEPINPINPIQPVKPAEPAAAAGGKRGRGKQRKYTQEDKRFIADENNSIGEIAEKYGYTKPYAYKMRHYFRSRLDNNNNDDDTDTAEDIRENNGDKHQKHMRYTEEDILFITDKKNSIDVVVKKYGFADKAAAYRARGYLKRVYIKK
jgi:mRNA-degrading endonuclease toxin of MazEF toxin-antitoxin module